MDKIKFQYYPARVKSNKPIGFTTLDYFIKSTKHPKQSVIDIFNRIATAESEGDMKLKSELKQNNLFYFTPAVIVGGLRRYKNIQFFTGLMVLDFDHIDYAEELKKYLFNTYNFIIAAWLSPSKKGIKALVSIPIVVSVDEFKEYYYGICTEMENYEGFDESGQNCVLPLFQSYDSNLLQRNSFETWDIKGEKTNDFNKSIPPVQISPGSDKSIIKLISSGFNNITDNGHPQLRGLCLAVGGYVSSGYINENEAINHINWNIENHNYLRKGVSGYKKTALWALNLGKNKPLSLKN